MTGDLATCSVSDDLCHCGVEPSSWAGLRDLRAKSGCLGMTDLLPPPPELPMRSILLSLCEEENATKEDVNASVSAGGHGSQRGLVRAGLSLPSPQLGSGQG